MEAAVAILETLAERRPDFETVVALGDLYASLGEDGRAAEQFDRALGIVAGYEGLGLRVDLMLAQFLADHGSPEEAVVRARAAYAARPSIFAADTLAWALHQTGRSDEALPYVRESLRTGIREAVFFFHAGIVQLAVGDEDAATQSLSTALEINPHFDPRQASEAREALRSLQAAVGTLR